MYHYWYRPPPVLIERAAGSLATTGSPLGERDFADTFVCRSRGAACAASCPCGLMRLAA